MIKVNVITNNINWHYFIKNPISYIETKIARLNNNSKTFAKKKIYCTLLLSGNKEIRYLNKKFRGKNKATDVLSFPFHLKKELIKSLKTHERNISSDIIINFKILEKDKNLENLIVYGFMASSSFGHDHKKEKDYLKMSKLKILLK